VTTTVRTKFEALAGDGGFPEGLEWPFEEILG